MSDLHERLVGFAVARLEALIGAHLPDLRIPRVFAGHPVAPDVRADLAFTVGLLGAYGVGSIAGRPTEDALEAILSPIDGAGTNTFFSYRIAETLLRHPRLLARFDPETRAEVLEACDSTAALPALDAGRVPRNYAAVLLRCEVARRRLAEEVGAEVAVDPATVEALTRRTIDLLTANAGGYLDDSHSRIGRYDIYSGDIYLFTEPCAELLGDAWTRGARSALDLVERVGASNGAAFSWGRSIGALATCLTIELAGLAAGHDLGADAAPWAARGAHAFGHLHPWFAADGLITAHQHRSTFGYRGAFRRLQMTLDCLGKLVDTAVTLQRAAHHALPDPATTVLFPDRDELIRFEDDRPAGVWTHRSRHLAFVLPIVGSTVSDYLPAPRNPGLFEVPVDADLPTGVPTVFQGGHRYTSGLLPISLTKTAGALELTYDAFPRARQFEVPEDGPPPLAGSRTVRYRVDRRTLHVDEELRFAEEVPDAVAVQVTETAGRPLRVTFRCDRPHATATIDVAGLKEYRSFWSELPTVHQIDVDPAPEIRLGWSVTPKLRILTTERAHHYTRAVFDPLVAAGDVVEAQVSRGRLPGDNVDLGRWDLFHLHWPEWYLERDVGRHRAAVERLRDAGVRIIWTQHNLVPHDKDPRVPEIYEVWAGAADGVVHHSAHGRRRVEERYTYRSDAEHRVIPHPSFGSFAPPRPTPAAGAPIRLGVLGAPRVEKDVQSVLDAFAATTRPDLELHVWSLRGDEVVPDDPRIHAETYRMVDRSIYDERLRSLDALVLPFVEADMITTGTVGDVIGAGIAALTSDWGFLSESLGGAGIRYGDDLTGTLERLDRARLDEAARVARSLRARVSSEAVAAAHLELLEAVGTTRL